MFDFWRKWLELVVRWSWSRMFTIWKKKRRQKKSFLVTPETKEKSSINKRKSNVERLVLSAFANQWRTTQFHHVPTLWQTRMNKCKNIKCKTIVRSLLVFFLSLFTFLFSSHTHTHTNLHISGFILLRCKCNYCKLTRRSDQHSTFVWVNRRNTNASIDVNCLSSFFR